MKTLSLCFTLFILCIILSCSSLWGLPCDSCTGTATGVGNGIGITGTVLGGMLGAHLHFPVGVEASLAAGFYDTDETQSGTTKDTVNPSGSGNGWTVTPFDNPVDGCWSNLSFTKTGTQAGIDTVSMQCSDNARCGSAGNDSDESGAFVVDWVDIGEITGAKEWYESDCITLQTPVSPATHDNDTSSTHGNFVKWYYSTVDSDTPVALPSGCSYTYNVSTGDSVCYLFLPKGKYKVYARVETPNGNGQYATYVIEVFALPSSNVEGTPCSEGGSGGGCGSGSCGSGGDGAPAPNIYKPLVSAPSSAIGSYGKDKSSSVCDTQPCFMVLESCGTVKWYFTSCEGNNIPVDFPQKTTAPPAYPNPYTVTLGSWTLKRIGAQDASSWSYTAQGIDGTLYTYGSGPSSDPKKRIVFPALQRIDYPDGTYEIFTDNGSGSYAKKIYAPNGTAVDSTDFILDTNERVTSVTGSDGNTVSIFYVEGSSLSTTPSTVQKRDSNNTVIGTTSYSYNSDGRISQVDLDGKQTGYTYTKDGSGNVTDITVTNLSASPQLVTKYTYDSTTTTVTRKHPTDAAQDQSTVTEFFVHNNVKTYVWKVTDPSGNVTRNGLYIPAGTTVTNKTADVDYKITANSLLWGKPFVVEDPNGNETTYTYNSTTGTVATITYPDNTTETYTYYTDASSNPTIYPRTVKNRRGNYTHYVRSASTLYRVDAIKSSEPVNGQEPSDWSTVTADKEYTYYPNNDSHGQGGRVATESVPNVDGTNAQVTGYIYYETVNGVEKLRGGATRTSYKYWNGSAYVDKYSYTSYDDAGRVMSTTDADNRTVYYTYDSKGRQLKTIYQASPEIADESSYTCCNLQWTKDSDGRETHYAYDDAGRVTKTWTNLTGQSETTPLVTYSYDNFGNKSSVTTYSNATTGRTTVYTYDKMNRVTKIDYPGDLGDEEFGYTNTGNVQWKKDGSNFVTLYKYDTYYRLSNVYYNYTGSLSTIVYPQTADVTYSYLSGTSMKSSMVDSTGTSSYGYDYKDRLTSYTPPKPTGHGSITYTYNALGQETSVTNGSFVVNYSYFANGWLRDVKRGTSTVADYVYDQVGNRIRVNYGNGTYQTYTYNPADPRYQLDKIDYAYRCAAGQPIAVQGSIGLTRDNSGNPLTWSALDMSTPQKNIYSKAYSYDQMSRLDSANYPGKGTTDFQYDWVGNRTNPGSMEYNASDQLIRWPNQHRYEYDGRGNLIYEKSDASVIQKTYAYTYSNLTSNITYAGVNKSSLMTWDAAGNRITFQSSTRANDTDTYTFVYDPTAGIPAVIEETTPTGINRYIREPGGALIARVSTVGETETTRYYHFDELGSTQFLTAIDGTVTDKYSYDAWGNLVSHVGNTQQPYQYVGRYGYYNHTQDSNLKMMQLGVRLYDSEIGRFVQVDPIQDGINWYVYAITSPLRYVDPSGFAIWWEMPGYGIVYYYHAYVTFEHIACNGERSAGFWPPAEGTNGKWKWGLPWDTIGDIKMPDTHENDDRSRRHLRNPSMEFEKALCKCIKASKKRRDRYKWPIIPTHACGGWLKDMWNCASKAIKKPVYHDPIQIPGSGYPGAPQTPTPSPFY